MSWKAKPKRKAKIDDFLSSEEGEPYLRYAKDDWEFAGWLACVDAWLENRLAVRFGDLPDQDWREPYESGLEPTLAAMNACSQEQLDIAYTNRNS